MVNFFLMPYNHSININITIESYIIEAIDVACFYQDNTNDDVDDYEYEYEHTHTHTPHNYLKVNTQVNIDYYE